MRYLKIIFIISLTLMLMSECKKENNFDDNENIDGVSYCDSTELPVQLVTDECADSVFFLNGQTERNYLTVYTSQFTMYIADTTSSDDIQNIMSKYNIIDLDTLKENYSQDVFCARGYLAEGLDCYSMISKLDSIENEQPVKYINPYLAISEDTRISFGYKYAVKLKEINDTTGLKCIANLLNSTFVAASEYNPLLIDLELKDNTGYNTFEIFRYLDSTGFFEWVEPGYWMTMPYN